MKQVIKPKIKADYDITDEPTIFTLILDMNSIMKMSLVDKRMNDKGEEYGMVYQTLLQIKKQMERKDYNFVYAFYDGYNSGQLRYNLYHDYKANRDKSFEDSSSPKTDYDKKIDDYCKKVLAYSKERKKTVKREETEDESFERQREIIFKCLEELYVRNLMCDDVEGDDLIAYYVNHKKRNEKIVIVSGDRDLTQLISDDVCIYATQLKKYLSVKNHKELMGYTHENVLLKKIFCGDSSDNIKGIKGLGEKSFFSLFPDARTKPMTVDDILSISREKIAERRSNGLKPLLVTENIVNAVTLGCQGKDIYRINDLIINLRKPLLTEEANEEIEALSYAPMDGEGRSFKNLFGIVSECGIKEFSDEGKFGDFFACYNKLIDNERKYAKKTLEEEKK